MKKFLLILLALVVVLIAAVVAVPFLLPMETYKQQIEAQVERTTGRALKIEGPLDISLLPRLAMTAEDVRLPTSRAARVRTWCGSRAAGRAQDLAAAARLGRGRPLRPDRA